MGDKRKSMHVDVPLEMKHALDSYCLKFRQRQNRVVEDALRQLAAKHAETDGPTQGPPMPPGPLVPLVPRVLPAFTEWVGSLSERTRVSRSDYVREALSDFLEAHDAAPWLRPGASAEPAPHERPVTLRLVP